MLRSKKVVKKIYKVHSITSKISLHRNETINPIVDLFFRGMQLSGILFSSCCKIILHSILLVLVSWIVHVKCKFTVGTVYVTYGLFSISAVRESHILLVVRFQDKIWTKFTDKRYRAIEMTCMTVKLTSMSSFFVKIYERVARDYTSNSVVRVI